MPLVRHQLHCCICLQPPEREHKGELAELISLWKQKGYLFEQSSDLCVGGFSHHRLEKYPSPRIYGNHQGGYKVRCRSCRQNIVSVFSHAVQDWRAGGPRQLCCPHCQHEQALEKCFFMPPVAFSRAALVLIDVEQAHFSQEVEQDIQNIVGTHSIVYRRIG